MIKVDELSKKVEKIEETLNILFDIIEEYFYKENKLDLIEQIVYSGSGSKNGFRE